MYRGILLLLFFCSFSLLKAQSITPFTLNIAGFTAQKDGYTLTVSTGEAISITNFTSPNGVSLNSGFLQNNPPIVTGIDDLLNKINENEVSISPNPTNSITNLLTNFNQPGQIQYQILDIGSSLLLRSPSINGFNARQTKIELTAYPAGVYYIQVFFKSTNGQSKTGIYKVVKL